MNTEAQTLMVPSSYSRIAARELGLQERDLARLLQGTGLPRSILMPGDEAHITAQQQMRVLDNAQHILGAPDFGLRLGRRLQPASHGPMGYMVLSSPDVLTALESFADFLPVRLPFSAVKIAVENEWLQCSLELKIDANSGVRRLLQECFALMIQSVVESVLGRELLEAQIALTHDKPAYHAKYDDYLHAPVQFSAPVNLFQVPIALARSSNAAGHSESYAVARDLCRTLLEQMPDTAMSTGRRVERLLLSSPMGSLTADDVARAMFVTKRTLQRRLDQEGTSYRGITEKLYAALADRHLREPNLTVETVAILLGYNDTAAFRKAFHRWYGQSPGEYRANVKSTD
ncbi:MAG: AraC family transcriptional regulator ligand-binding domain-containing protein [Halioglobus sp.]